MTSRPRENMKKLAVLLQSAQSTPRILSAFFSEISAVSTVNDFFTGPRSVRLSLLRIVPSVANQTQAAFSRIIFLSQRFLDEALLLRRRGFGLRTHNRRGRPASRPAGGLAAVAGAGSQRSVERV